MGLHPVDKTHRNAKKKWKPEEDYYLEEKWGTVSLKTISKNLGRSENAVIVRVARLGLGPALLNCEQISWNVFVKTLTGTNSGGYLKQRLIKAGFPVHKKVIRGGGKTKRRVTVVDIDEFWEFAEQNKDLFDFSRLEPLAFGEEPEWATLKRKLDAERLRKTKPHNEPWTKADDQRLQRLLKQYRYTYTDLAEILGRSEGAVKRRIITQGITERPIRNENRPWTPEEEKKLVEMKEQGYGYDNIAQELKRSALCVREKYERILNPEYMKRRYRGGRSTTWESTRSRPRTYRDTEKK